MPINLALLQNAASATGNGTAIDTTAASSVVFDVSGTFTATVSFEATIDGSGWFALPSVPVAGGAPVTSTTATGRWVAACAGYAQCRARVTWTSGTSVTVRASATAVEGAPPTLPVTLATKIAGEDQTYDRLLTAGKYNYANITTATTTVVKGSAGVLIAIVVNKAVAAGVRTIYDNTAGSGTKIGTQTMGASVLDDPGKVITFNVGFSTGLTVVTSAAEDLTVVYL